MARKTNKELLVATVGHLSNREEGFARKEAVALHAKELARLGRRYDIAVLLSGGLAAGTESKVSTKEIGELVALGTPKLALYWQEGFASRNLVAQVMPVNGQVLKGGSRKRFRQTIRGLHSRGIVPVLTPDFEFADRGRMDGNSLDGYNKVSLELAANVATVLGASRLVITTEGKDEPGLEHEMNASMLAFRGSSNGFRSYIGSGTENYVGLMEDEGMIEMLQ